jgi:putative glutamine amidotransferase
MPRVAVTYRNEKKIEPYLAALCEVRIEPFRVTPDAPLDSLDAFQGLLLTGGNDVDPSRYGQAPHPKTNPDPARDALELRLLGQALDRDLPVLAICRGAQLFNVAHSGTLHQDIEGHEQRGEDPSLAAHEVTITPGTKLAQILGDGPLPVNSRHHQAADRAGKGLIVSARAPDGVIEALERPDLGFALAVQWHPEDQLRRFEAQRALFQAFSEALSGNR